MVICILIYNLSHGHLEPYALPVQAPEKLANLLFYTIRKGLFVFSEVGLRRSLTVVK